MKRHTRAQWQGYVRVLKGIFEMGCVEEDDECDADEEPRHTVEISKDFWVGRTEVTVAQYRQFVEDKNLEMPPFAPSFNSDWGKPDHPIVNVTWEEAKTFCEWAGGRLPTEAEWEYVARGGEEGLKYPWGNEISPDNARYDSGDGTAPVGSYPANDFGIYDVSGNAWECVADWYDGDYYENSPEKDPQGPEEATVLRVLRGGSWLDYPVDLRAAGRYRLRPGGRYSSVGFRCVREVVSP